MTVEDFITHDEAFDRYHAANDQLENHYDEHTPSERRVLRGQRAAARHILEKGQGAEASLFYGMALVIEGMSNEEQWFTVEEGNAIRKAAAVLRAKALESERRHRGFAP